MNCINDAAVKTEKKTGQSIFVWIQMMLPYSYYPSQNFLF